MSAENHPSAESIVDACGSDGYLKAMAGIGGARALGLGVVALVVGLPFGCSERPLDVSGGDGAAPSTGGRGSAGKGAGGSGGSVGGTAGGGGTATGGTGAQSGSSGQSAGGAPSGGNAGTTNDTGMSGEGGAGSGGTTSDAGEGGMGGASACVDLVAGTTLVASTVTLLVDDSSSMFETMPAAWDPLYDALMDPSFGVVKSLEHKIRFGFAAYRGSSTPKAEDDVACADWTLVPAALDNHGQIDAAYGSIVWPDVHPKWETPTGHAIHQAATALAADTAPGQKILLLITDGNPNTCEVLDPQCGQDTAIRATQDAYAAGVTLIAVGIGDIVAQPNNGCPTSARCGPLHLQDLANAGRGFPVRPPPSCEDPTAMGCIYKHEACIPGQVLQASYTPSAPDAVAPLILDTASSPSIASLAAAITGVLDDVVSCTVDLDVNVTGDASVSTVLVGNTPATLGGSTRGFTLDPNGHAITLTGTACADFRDDAALSVRFGCDPDTGLPVATRR